MTRTATLVLALVLLATPLALGDPIQVSVAPGETVFVDLSGDPLDADDTGVRLRNDGLFTTPVVVEFLPGDPLAGGRGVEGGFVLLDGTLSVETALAPGDLRAAYRMEYREARARSLDKRTMRMFRLDERAGIWKRAIRGIRRRARAELRFVSGRADFTLGHFGVDEQQRYVWSVLDVNSSYAIGGLPLPEPSALALLAGGALLLLGSRRLSG